MRTSLVFAAAAGLAATVATANADFKVIGGFNVWDNATSVLMAPTGPGVWGATIPATPGVSNAFKVNVGDWSTSWPYSGNVTAVPTGSSIDVHFYDNPAPNDGWSPNNQRVGYTDQGGTGWELMGSINAWASPFGTLSSLGGGLYKGTVFMLPGTWEFKFRSSDPAINWDANVGDTGGDGSNASITVPAPAVCTFQLDVLHGRWTTAVPAPASLALLGLGGLAAGRRRR